MLRSCRSCRSDDLCEVLDLGLMPLAGDFRALGEVNKRYPLAVDLCRRCGLLQVREIVPPSVLFNANYSYASSTVPALVAHFEAYAESARLTDGRGKQLLEIGCNDGVFLGPLRSAGYEVVGIDASENVALMARNKGIDVHVALFGTETSSHLRERYGRFDIVTCSNVFAHNPELHEFVTGVVDLLKPDGEFWLEVHSGHALHDSLQWDCIYHEHCFYWTIHSLTYCLEQFGLGLQHYTFTDMHGGGIRAVYRKRIRSAPIRERALLESDWAAFRYRSLRSRDVIRDVVSALPIHYAYGAAGRAVTLINWTGISEQLEFVVDGSPLRFGRAIPNTAVPVIAETEFFQRESCSDWCFVTAHNYLSGIAEKVRAAFPRRSMKFVSPLPTITVQ